MEVYGKISWLFILGVALLAFTLQGVQGEAEVEGPSESECRPYIEKALKEQEKGEPTIAEQESQETQETIEPSETVPESQPTPDASSTEEVPAVDDTAQETDDSVPQDGEQDETHEDKQESVETETESESQEPQEGASIETEETVKSEETTQQESLDEESTTEPEENNKSEAVKESIEEEADAETETKEAVSVEQEEVAEEQRDQSESQEADQKSVEDVQKSDDAAEADQKSNEAEQESDKTEPASEESDKTQELEQSEERVESEPAGEEETKSDEKDTEEDKKSIEKEESREEQAESIEDARDETKEESKEQDTTESIDDQKDELKEDEKEEAESEEKASRQERSVDEEKPASESIEDGEGEKSESVERGEEAPEDQLIVDEIDIPDEIRPRDHVEHLLKLDRESSEAEIILDSVSEITLRELKKIYESAIKPLEVVYKYRDLSNRHFGDSEIFSKPLILFMGPWSGGKSSIINYLVDNEYNETSLRTGAEPSPAYFNILMYGDEPEVIDGTQLAADYTFSGLQKFGQGLEERLRGLKLPRKLLEKVNIVEIPGILEVRKQVSRVFPFNDACQWFIDRADSIFLVYDPSKLDVGPETEAILDQLKGREHQTRIILNKADQVKPEELMRVQSALIWNISPLMSSPQPPVMYTTSLWSRPYESWAPTRLLQAQERAFLRDLRAAIDKRIENKIASARRFAVRVRNHAKMVDCYLTTYYNHKSVFGNRKQVAEQIIEHPQDYHIYEGLSTLTNISRYDLPDPDVYKDFFHLNPLYDFQQLSATCTYFRGCPINRLDVAIAYDLPELVGKHRRLVESALQEASSHDKPPQS